MVGRCFCCIAYTWKWVAICVAYHCLCKESALGIIQGIGLYFHTLRHMRGRQIAYRLWYRIYRPRPDVSPSPAQRFMAYDWAVPAMRPASMVGHLTFCFLNEIGCIHAADDWNNTAKEKLWLYNLHYFDDLNAEGASERRAWHRSLIRRWIDENPPASGVGWDPYPLSLRIVNWIKWSLAGNDLDEGVRHSLAIQVRSLYQRLEYHLLGNHLFVNAKALIFAGCYFEGKEAGSWFQKGMAILEREVPEQILADGGHFERSPMYHALAYEDMLDLINLASAYPEVFVRWQDKTSKWQEVIERMADWLLVMCHPDGEIAFFNDSAMGVAPAPDKLFQYARRLGFPRPIVKSRVVWLKDSGYIRVSIGEVVLIVDVAPVGPDYLPGHAHADTLSYEFSIGEQRIVVNTGTSRYGLGEIREFERSTAAHNTVEIGGHNSSEVWAGFRVARRAQPFSVSVKETDDSVVVDAAHDGYTRLAGSPVHRRQWVVSQYRLVVQDSVEGDDWRAISKIYLHPAMAVQREGTAGIVVWQGRQIDWQAEGAQVTLNQASWHPEFGASVANWCLGFHFDSTSVEPVCRLQLEWG